MSPWYDDKMDGEKLTATGYYNPHIAAHGTIDGVGVYPVQLPEYVLFQVGSTFYYRTTLTGPISSGYSDLGQMMMVINDLIAAGGNPGAMGLTASLNNGLCETALVLDNTVSIIGLAHRKINLDFSLNITTDCISWATNDQVQACRLEGFHITSTDNLTRHGIHFKNGDAGIVLKSLTVDEMGTDGYHIDGAYTLSFYDCVGNSNGRHGVSVTKTGSTSVSDLLFVNVTLRGNTEDGYQDLIAAIGGSRRTFINLLCEINGMNGAFMRGSIKKLISCNFENNDEYGLRFTGPGVIDTCQFQSAPATHAALQLSTASNLKIINPRFNSNDGDDISIDGSSYNIIIENPIDMATTDFSNLMYDTKIYGENEFLGEITDGNGRVTLSFTGAFTNKPKVSISLETNNIWYVRTWNTDVGGRYTSCVIQVTSHAGIAVGAGVTVNAYVDIQR